MSASAGNVRPMHANVSKLRRKLGDEADAPAYIFIEPRVGYRMSKGERWMKHSVGEGQP